MLKEIRFAETDGHKRERKKQQQKKKKKKKKKKKQQKKKKKKQQKKKRHLLLGPWPNFKIIKKKSFSYTPFPKCFNGSPRLK